MQTPQETPQGLLTTVLAVWPYIAAVSASGAIGSYLAWITLPPKLTIESVIDKHKAFSSESHFVIKNGGRLPAWNIRADLEKTNVQYGAFTMNNSKTTRQPNEINLDHNEATEIPILNSFFFQTPVRLTRCDFELILKYDVRFLIFKKELQRKWKVELRNYEDSSFTWNFRLI